MEHGAATGLQRLNRLCKHVICEGFTAVTMKNVVFWDIDTQFVPHRRHITSPLQSPAAVCCENCTEHTDKPCGQSVPHRKHITSPLQSPVAVCCENRTEHTDTPSGQSVPHRKHITSPLKSPVAVCCENRTKHTDTLWAVRTSQETRYVSTTEPSRLILCKI
jgi:hypothetical protein